MKYVVSSCLLGENCKYNGKNNYQQCLADFLKDKEYVCVCPEVLGGLSIPRPSCEIQDGCVVTACGQDVSAQFFTGAKRALAIAKKENVTHAILQSRSPSCGVQQIYNGKFERVLIKGNGIFTEQLEVHGICCMDINTFLDEYYRNRLKNDEIGLNSGKKTL